jgi:WD40 repeat protein
MVDINNVNQNQCNINMIDMEAYSRENLKSLKESKIVGKHEGAINFIISLPNNFIASSSNDKTIKIWDINNNICMKSLDGHKGDVNCLALLSNGIIASSSSDCTIRIWNYSKENICDIKTSNSLWPRSSLLVLSDGQLVSGNLIGRIAIFDNQKVTNATILFTPIITT